MLFSSCSGAPRKMIGTVLQNKPKQYFGFTYSPDGVNLPPEAFVKFHKESGEFGNGVAWLNNFTWHRTADFMPAGAYVTGVAETSAEARAIVWPDAQTPIVYSLWFGIGTGANLPSTSALPKVFMKTEGACRFDVQNQAQGDTTPRCASPDLDFDGSVWQTVCAADFNSTQMPLSGTPTRRVQSSTTGSAVGTQFSTFKPKFKQYSTLQLAEASSALGQYMSGVRVDPKSIEPLIQANITQGAFSTWNTISGDGLATSFDSTTQRLLVFDAIVPESNAAPIDRSAAAQIFEQLGDGLPLLGLPDRKYWTFDKPVVSEIIDSEFAVDGSGLAVDPKAKLYTMKVFRKINGTPWLDSYLTAWVHRSGQVMKLEVTAMDVDSTGGPDAEVPVTPLPTITRLIGLTEARLKVSKWLTSRGYSDSDSKPADAVAYTFTPDRKLIVPKYFAGVDLRTEVTNSGRLAELLSGTRLLSLDLDNPEASINVVQ